jgi:lipopolysaccharide export system permease protein
MIFQRAIRRELLNTFAAVFTTLFTVVITVMLIRILGDAAAGKIAPSDVAAMLGFATVGYLSVLLSLTIFIAVLLVVARSYQDSEMAVWLASGVSLTRWIRPVMSVGMPVVIITAIFSIWLTPWANRSSAEYRERFKQREDVSRVSPGKFQESSSGDRIFFVEGLADDASKVSNVFVRERGRKDSVVAAEEGTIQVTPEGDRKLELFRGRRYEGTPGDKEFRLVEFTHYSVILSQNERALGDNTAARVLPTWQLIREPKPSNHGELLWRVAIPFMCLMQTLVAIPLGFVNPRRGRGMNLIIALLLNITYYNLIGTLQGEVSSGRMAFGWSWWPLHLFMLILVVLLFFWRDNITSRWHPARVVSFTRSIVLMRKRRLA